MSATARTYRGLVLDPFQAQAIDYIEQNESVIVSAPTGVGKTLIADYLIEKVYGQKMRTIYTAPIKALSNQKFRDFCQHLGEDAVGIMTGDAVINPDASVLVMTTEIFRNQLQHTPEQLSNVPYVVFDEIHYIDDPRRGSVWEESLIFMPDTMRFLGLSATIPNGKELAGWIESIHGRPIQLVRQTERIVPLEHRLFEKSLGVVTSKQLSRKVKQLGDVLTDQRSRSRLPETRHVDLLDALGDGHMPMLFFCFSRRRCETNGLELAELRPLLDQRMLQEIAAVATQVLERYPEVPGERWPSLLQLLQKGVAYHHAGMLPALKHVVEELFCQRLIKVLYCTETFAVGLNFPCKTVCFESSMKWDGINFRPLMNREYFQMAGRAGRRGIDPQGHVFTVINLRHFRPTDLPSMKESHVEPLQSQFVLSYNSVLNLIRSHDQASIDKILGQNFAAYQSEQLAQFCERQIAATRAALEEFCPLIEDDRCPKAREDLELRLRKLRAKSRLSKKRRNELRKIQRRLSKNKEKGCPQGQRSACVYKRGDYRRLQVKLAKLRQRQECIPPQDRFLQEFAAKRAVLVRLGYIDGSELTASGQFACKIYGHELLVTELFMEGLLHQYGVDELNGVLVSIGYEPRRDELVAKHPLRLRPVAQVIQRLQSIERQYVGAASIEFHPHAAGLAYRWSRGEPFADVLSDTQLDEGDLVFSFRRGIDLARQIRGAAGDDQHLTAKMRQCITKMDRDQVSIWL